MTKSDFSRTFLDRIGYGTPIQQRARKGQLGDQLMLLELAALVAESDVTAEEYVALENAVHRGELRATLKAIPPPANEAMQRIGANMQREDKGTPRLEPPPLVHRYSVHRDDARRYFRSLRLEPEPRSPLWCWINNADENSPPSASSNTVEADAKQRAIDLWAVSKTITVTGDNGMGAQLEREFPRSRKTLEKWARAVAPPEVSARTGRPEKSPN